MTQDKRQDEIKDQNATATSFVESVVGQTHNPDVLSCLANLSNDEVFTPPEVVNQILDALPQKLFRDPKTTFLDPACKSGVFLREIAKRLIRGLENAIPDLSERLDHIYKKQLFGIAITELTSLVARRTLYCSLRADSEYSIANFDTPEGNIRFHPTDHQWVDGKCAICGAAEAEFGKKARRENKDNHAYEFIHHKNPQEIFNVKFDVIVGNPPYQLSDGGNKSSSTPIYNLFVEQAKQMNPRYITMIIPARWYSGGKGLDAFRYNMLNDSHIKILVDYSDSEDCFPGVDIAGGICYFLIDSTFTGKCIVTNILKGNSSTHERTLNEYATFIRHFESLTVIEKIRSNDVDYYSMRVSSRKPFGLPTNTKPNCKKGLTLRYGGGYGFIKSSDITTGNGLIDKWKVIISYLTYDHAGRPDNEGKRRIFSTMEILPPNSVCTETYLVVDYFTTKKEAENLCTYLKTKFVRFLVSQLTFTQHITKGNFAFVPIQDFSKPWTDEELYKKYNLTDEEIAFIESMIRPME